MWVRRKHEHHHQHRHTTPPTHTTHHKQHNTTQQGLKVVPCGQARAMMEVARTGMRHRRVGAHQLNMESSRSHAIMTVYVDATPTGALSAVCVVCCVCVC